MATVLAPVRSKQDVLNEAIGQGVGNFIESGSKAYQNRADEMAIQKAISELPTDAAPRDILDALTGARTYSQQAKQTAITNYLKGSELSQKGTGKLPPFQKKLQEKQAEDYHKATEDKQKLESNLQNLDYVDELIDQLGVTSPIKSYFGSEKAAELEGVAFPLIESIVKLFNPSGPIAEKKFKRLAH